MCGISTTGRDSGRVLYAWTVEGSISTGSLVAWAHDYVNGHYSGIAVASVVVQLQAVDPDGSGIPIRAVPHMVHVYSDGRSDDDMMMQCRAVIYLGNVMDVAHFEIDGRA